MAPTMFSTLVSCQLCVLEERPDPSQGGALRWSLPYKERCYCQRVVAPRKYTQTCTSYKDRSVDKKLWFVDDPTPLTNRMNWNKEALDILLEREEYCESNECSSNPCEHGGVCYDRIGEYICACPEGLSGSRCETDHGDPVLASCPANQATNTDPGQSTAMIAWQGPVATDNSGVSPAVNCDPPSGSNFTIRQTLVTCTASDRYGNNASCAFNVDVLVWDLMQSSQMTKSPPQSQGRQRLPTEYWSRENGMGHHQPRLQPD
ncbi:sushi, von Willebrand factor type A, EGF and pentraxin domain-containing protein 1-like [Amphiura filiformis]|uniref:sushi, von Willebrand factor type A, EGF and pentraxin domain-containing protein 1-like n=1 Tax=Amphiura filiformis TaxID=82378 RepID=UPI003B20FCA7